MEGILNFNEDIDVSLLDDVIVASNNTRNPDLVSILPPLFFVVTDEFFSLTEYGG